MRCDVLIRNGMVYDGVSPAGRLADIAVADGKIVSIEPAQPQDKHAAPAPRDTTALRGRTIDATGLAIMPGFIDIHSHSDLAWFVWPNATSKLLAGVTTDVSGNCGLSGFPLAGETLARRRAEYGRYGLDINWATAAEYFARLEGSPCGVNRAVLVGHGNLRGVTIGYGNVPAAPDARAKMKTLLAEGMEAGAFGLSSGLIYAPGLWATADELADLVAVVRERGGFYASHIRDEHEHLLEAIEEFLGVLERTGCRGVVSHIKGADKWATVRARLDAARSAGVNVWADRYPYTASCTSLTALVLPGWAIEGKTQHVLARIANPRDRKRIIDEISARGEAFFENVKVINFSQPGLTELCGQSLAEVGRLLGKRPIEAALDLLVEDRLEPEAVHFCMSESEVAEIYRWPFVMVGSDYSARDALAPGEMCHPRAFGTPAAFLGRFVRELNVCDWPAAASKLATLAADMLGLADRGRIAPGCWADLVLLDPQAVADRATYRQPRQSPAGIECVLVNGQVAVESGRFTGAMAGKVLRKG